MGAATAMWLLGQGLKRLWRRPRPYRALEEFRLLIAEPAGTTWPSSHPAVLLAFVTVAARDLDASPRVRAAVAALAGTVGLSRVYLGVHWISDAGAGVTVGALWVTIATVAYETSRRIRAIRVRRRT